MSELHVSDISPGFGSVVEGVDLTGDLDPETRRALRALFDDRSVLLFRGVDVDHASQDRLCRLLVGDDGPGTDAGRVARFISNRDPEALAPYGRLLYHVDMMWAPNPFEAISLYAVDVEPGAATTSLVSGVYAWETLPSDLRRRVENLHAVHVTGQVYSRGGDDLLHPERAEERSTVTPVAKVHPRTGKTILFVSQQMTREIVELPPDESEELLQALFAHLYDPAVVYEHEWRNGDLVVFDNLAAQHARGNVEPNGPARTLRKAFAPVPIMSAEVPTFANASAQ